MLCQNRKARLILPGRQPPPGNSMMTRGTDMNPVLRTARVTAMGIVATCALATSALAQKDKMTPVPTPAQPNAIELGTPPLPGATAQESWHSQYGSLFARNVTVATLTPHLPDPSIASGTAVVVAPGGGFRTLSMENEGSNVAKALAAKGVAAFVLKYRLVQTPPDMAGFENSMRQMFSGAARRPPRPSTPDSMAASIAPQLFAAVAIDDPLLGGGETGIVKSWIAAKRPVEVHLFEQGGHGFGMYPKETTSTGWFDEFVRWLD